MLNRGTTPLHSFALPDELSGVELSALYISYAQCGRVRLEKALGDAGVVASGGTITVQLTQEDTLAFSGHSEVRIQIRLKTANGDALASNIISVPVGEILKDGVI